MRTKRADTVGVGTNLGNEMNITSDTQLRIAPGTADHYTAPIRSLPEVARIMREKGDVHCTAGTVWHVEQRALAKLRPLLESYNESDGAA